MNFLTDEERALLLEIPSEEAALYRVYTLAPHEIKFVRRANQPHSRVDRALHLVLLKWPGAGFKLGERIPPELIAFLCKQLRLPQKAFQPGGRIGQSHTRMARDVAEFLGMEAFTASHIPLMTKWAENEAAHTNNKLRIVEVILSELRRSKIIIPAWDTIERAAQAGLWGAKEASLKAINSHLGDDQKRKLDLLVVNDIRFRSSPLAWLRNLKEDAKIKHFHALIGRLEYLRQLGIPNDISEALTPWQYSRLKQRGNRARPVDIMKYSNDLRHAVLAIQVVHLSLTFSDGAVRMFSALTRKQFETAIRINKERFAESKEDGIDVWMAYREAASALKAVKSGADVDIAVDSTLGGWDEVQEMDDKAAVLVHQSTQDKFLTASERFTTFSHFVPAFLDSFSFTTNAPDHPLLRAIDVVRNSFESKAPIPDDAPLMFLPKSWQRMVKVDGNIDRKRYITAVTSAVEMRLHSGDLNVEGSSSYLSLDKYLVPSSQVAELSKRLPFVTDVNNYLAERKEHLHQRLKAFQEKLLDGALEGVRLVNGRLSITPIRGEPVPGLEAAGNKIDRLMPQKQIADVFHEIHEQTGVFDCFINSEGQCYHDIRVVMAAVWAIASGLGLEHMAMASPDIELAQLEWVVANFITEENLDRAIERLVAYQRGLPYARYVGDAGLTSSDGQFIPHGRVPVGAGTYNPQHGSSPGIVHYTQVNGQYMVTHTKVLSASEPEAAHVLDGLVYRGSGLGDEPTGKADDDIREHSTDTRGATDQLFGGFRMIKVRFRPRYRNLPRLKLGYIGSAKPYGGIATLLGAPVNAQLIKDNWQGILRVGVSFVEGAVLPSLIFRRFSAYKQDNQLAAAFGEFGRMDRTDFILDYLEKPSVRKDTQIRLNKGEAEHLLRDAMRLGAQGRLLDRSHDSQILRAKAMSFVEATIVTTNTRELDFIVQELAARGQPIPEEILHHITPLGWKHINLTGQYFWDKRQGMKTVGLHVAKPKLLV